MAYGLTTLPLLDTAHLYAVQVCILTRSPRFISVPSVENVLRKVDQESLTNATPTESKYFLISMGFNGLA